MYEYSHYPLHVIATGWGLTDSNGRSTELLKKVELAAFTLQECRTHQRSNRRMQNGVAASQLCYGDKSHRRRDTCEGDSGGPIQVERYYRHYDIVGVTSFGLSICGSKTPAVYTKISYYIPWIHSILIK